jgi:phage recombination protein Bet
MDTQKITLRDRKKAQPKAVVFFSPAEQKVIEQTVARSLTPEQKNIFFYTCQALGLNPLLNEIACVTYRNANTGQVSMSIQVMRDGFLTIAHRSGKFSGMESGVNISEDGKTVVNGWAKVYHKDFTVPVYQEADFTEYNTPTKGGKPTLWATKPKTMIKKVAESMALRKAFNINGVYAPEEMEREIVISEGQSLDKTVVEKIEKSKTVKELIDNCKKAKTEHPGNQKEIVELYNKLKGGLK